MKVLFRWVQTYPRSDDERSKRRSGMRAIAAASSSDGVESKSEDAATALCSLSDEAARWFRESVKKLDGIAEDFHCSIRGIVDRSRRVGARRGGAFGRFHEVGVGIPQG